MPETQLELHSCECDGPGSCNKFNRPMTRRMHGFCSRTSGDRQKEDRYISFFYKDVDSVRENRNQPCIFLGEVLSQTDENGNECKCPIRWLRGCEIHGECCVSSVRNSVASCADCTEYENSVI